VREIKKGGGKDGGLLLGVGFLSVLSKIKSQSKYKGRQGNNVAEKEPSTTSCDTDIQVRLLNLERCQGFVKKPGRKVEVLFPSRPGRPLEEGEVDLEVGQFERGVSLISLGCLGSEY